MEGRGMRYSMKTWFMKMGEVRKIIAGERAVNVYDVISDLENIDVGRDLVKLPKALSFYQTKVL